MSRFEFEIEVEFELPTILMLENWLQAPKVASIELSAWQFGTYIDTYEKDSFPNLQEAKVALLGIGKETDNIRKYLYQMAFSFGKFQIADIGNLRNPTEEGLFPVVQELLASKILPIIISTAPHPFTAQYKAYQEKYKKLNLAIIDEKVVYHKNADSYLSLIRKVKRPRLANLGYIGYQSHLSPADSIKYYHKKNYDCIRLGMAKSQMEQIEPAIRDANSLYFNLSALKKAEAPGVWHTSPSGFTSEEACRICHYAGMNDKLSSIGFYGYCPEKDTLDRTAQLTAQLIWYLIEGVYFRKNDFPVTTDGMIEYIVSFKEYDFNIVFWKSTKSGRWWMQAPANSGKKKKGLIPCAYEDYLMACKEQLSERILNIMERLA